MKDIENRKGYEPVMIKIYIKDKGVVLEEISLVSIDKNTNKIIAIGEEARKFKEDYNEDIITVCPLRWGVIADYTLSVKMFQYFFQKAIGRKSIFVRKPKVAVCVPKDTTEVEHKAFIEAFLQMGARDVFFYEFTFEETLTIIPIYIKIIVGIVPIK